MNLTIPLYIKLTRPSNAPLPTYAVRPLFFLRPSRNGEMLSRVTAKLATDLREKLDAIGRKTGQQELAGWAFSPELTEHRVTGNVILRRQTVEVSLLSVSFSSAGQRLAFFPELPDVWFQVPRGQSVAGRAEQVLTDYLLQREKKEEEGPILASLRERGQSWLSSIDLEVPCDPQLSEQADQPPFLLLGADEPVHGQAALERVGRCLDRLYPDELDRVVERDEEVNEVYRRLAEEDRRPMLLLGPRSVGKTAILHECIWRRVEKTGNPHRRKRNVWLLSPHRLISGMSYGGQWEGRVIAILKEAKHRDHTLYFDDVLGLYSAGVTCKSSLSVGDLLRPYVERRDVRVVAEMTPEAFGVLQERDRAMADLFHVVSVRPTGEDQTRKILFSVTRQLESQHRCRFGLDALPAAMDLQRRYVADSAMPGKAAGFLRQLAVRHSQKPIDRAAAIEEFGTRSGLSLAFLDDRARLSRTDIIANISENVIGQSAAVGAMADAVCIAKARLNDCNRPLATLLFLGPTGVGKTQCAKALGRYLYGDEQRLIRVDMNEFVDGAAASRLVGTFYEPEGILTSTVRRRPFSVVLLDEIEKAHPAIFDLLLQVLGEGRLTDAHGRTASFANAIIVMTSNLGVREAMTRFGLRPVSSDGAEAYRRSAEMFFRPEFFNRIDRIVPFEQLSREHIGAIAARLISEVLHRDGLVNRRCVLQIDHLAMKKIVEAGYHPDLGARALKREVERLIAAPVARRLAMMRVGSPMVVSVLSAADGVAVEVQELTNAAPIERPSADFADPADALDRAEAALARIEASVDEADTGAALTQGQVSQEHFRYLVIREQVRRVQHLIDRADDALARQKPSPRLQHAVRRSRMPVKARIVCDAPRVWNRLMDIAQAESLADLLPDPAGDQSRGWEANWSEILHELAMLQAMAEPQVADRVMLLIRPLADAKKEVADLASIYLKVFDRQHGAAVRELMHPSLPIHQRVLVIETPGAGRIFAGEHGTHLLITGQGRAIPVQVLLFPLEESRDRLGKLIEELDRQQRFRESVALGRASPADDPVRIGPVIRIYEHEIATIDLRTGLAIRSFPAPDDLRRFIMEMLPLPAELRA